MLLVSIMKTKKFVKIILAFLISLSFLVGGIESRAGKTNNAQKKTESTKNEVPIVKNKKKTTLKELKAKWAKNKKKYEPTKTKKQQTASKRRISKVVHAVYYNSTMTQLIGLKKNKNSKAHVTDFPFIDANKRTKKPPVPPKGKPPSKKPPAGKGVYKQYWDNELDAIELAEGQGDGPVVESGSIGDMGYAVTAEGGLAMVDDDMEGYMDPDGWSDEGADSMAGDSEDSSGAVDADLDGDQVLEMSSEEAADVIEEIMGACDGDCTIETGVDEFGNPVTHIELNGIDIYIYEKWY